MRQLTTGSLQYTFLSSHWINIKPMVKITRVIYRMHKKRVTQFYAEIVNFEPWGLCLLVPTQEVICRDDHVFWNKRRLSHDEERIAVANERLRIRKGDYFMGKTPIRLSQPLRVLGRGADLVKCDILQDLRHETAGALQFSFRDKIDWDIKPMVKIRKVSLRGGKKKVVEFYGELVNFEDKGVYLMIPSHEVIQNGTTDKGYCLPEDDGKAMRINAASRGLSIKKADYFMGKYPVEFENPMYLQGCSAALVKIKDFEK